MELHLLTYGKERIFYEIRFSKRRSRKMAIHVLSDGIVQVEAPSGVDRSAIRKAMRERARWVTEHMKKIREQRAHVLPRGYISGESHLYLGRQYHLKVVTDETCDPGVKMQRGRIYVFTRNPSTKAVRALLSAWYRDHAEKVFPERLRALAPAAVWLEGRTPSIRLLDTKKQWGSCSPDGGLLLNPHLIKAPRECVDYVISHELCHLRVHNHGPDFYCLLKSLMPDWKSVKKKLDDMAELILNQ